MIFDSFSVSVQRRALAVTESFNKMLKGVIPSGVHQGFEVALAGGLNVNVGVVDGSSTAMVDSGEFLLTVQATGTETLTIPIGNSSAVVEAIYTVDNPTTFDIKIVQSHEVNAEHLVLADFIVPVDTIELTQAMCDLSNRVDISVIQTKSDIDALEVTASSVQMYPAAIVLSSAKVSTSESLRAPNSATPTSMTYPPRQAPNALTAVGEYEVLINGSQYTLTVTGSSMRGIYFSSSPDMNETSVSTLELLITSLDIELSSPLLTGEEYYTDTQYIFTGDGTSSYTLSGATEHPTLVRKTLVPLATGFKDFDVNIDTMKGGIAGIGARELTQLGKKGYASDYRIRNPRSYGSIGDEAVDFSFAPYFDTTCGASGDYSFALGYNTTASGHSSNAMGRDTTASGYASTAMGKDTTTSGDYAFAIGYSPTASGDYSFAVGYNAEASGRASCAMGIDTKASGRHSTATCLGTTASGSNSFATGTGTTAAQISSICMGVNGGIGTGTDTLMGLAYSPSPTGDITTTSNDTNLVFSVSNSGNGYFDGAADSGNADYAEYFESFDGSTLERGYFVSFVDGSECLEYGNSNIVGIVSASPAVVGDTQSLHYKGKYKKDEFGVYAREMVKITENIDNYYVFEDLEVSSWKVSIEDSFRLDTESLLIEIKNVETQEVLETITDRADLSFEEVYDFEVEVSGNYSYRELHKVLAEGFDETKEYIPRSERPEWSPIGLLGKLWVHIANGESIVTGDYITSDTYGKAVKCLRADEDSFRVMEVNAECSLVRVLYK